MVGADPALHGDHSGQTILMLRAAPSKAAAGLSWQLARVRPTLHVALSRRATASATTRMVTAMQSKLMRSDWSAATYVLHTSVTILSSGLWSCSRCRRRPRRHSKIHPGDLSRAMRAQPCERKGGRGGARRAWHDAAQPRPRREQRLHQIWPRPWSHDREVAVAAEVFPLFCSTCLAD